MSQIPDENDKGGLSSWQQAFAVNQRNIVLMGAWQYKVENVDTLFGFDKRQFDSIEEHEKELNDRTRKMNREHLRLTMSVLCEKVLNFLAEEEKKGNSIRIKEFDFEESGVYEHFQHSQGDKQIRLGQCSWAVKEMGVGHSYGGQIHSRL